MSNIADEYRHEKKIFDDSSKQIQHIIAEYNKAIDSVENDFETRINALRKQEAKKIDDLNSFKELDAQPFRDSQIAAQTRIKEIKNYLELATMDPFVQKYTAGDIHGRHHFGEVNYSTKYPPVEFFEVIYEKDFIFAFACIAQNNKPKNKYSLIIAGHCRYMFRPRDTGSFVDIDVVDRNTHRYLSFKTEIKAAPTIKGLLKYYEKNVKNNFENLPAVKDSLKTAQEKEDRYQVVMKNYKLEDLLQTTDWYCPNCHNYEYEAWPENLQWVKDRGTCSNCKTPLIFPGDDNE